jgi:hypothetical protein
MGELPTCAGFTPLGNSSSDLGSLARYHHGTLPNGAANELPRATTNEPKPASDAANLL